jgi:hypothetical protein
MIISYGAESRYGCSSVRLHHEGTTFPLWECDDCGAMVLNPGRHALWHEDERKHRA